MHRPLLLPSAVADLETTRVRAALRSRLKADEAEPIHGDLPLLLRQMLRNRSAIREAEIVHAFGGAALVAAVLGGARRIVFQPVGIPSRRMIGWLRAIGTYRPLDVVVSSAEVQRLCVGRGVPIDRCTLIRPGVNLSLMQVRRDETLRQSLGLAEADIALLIPLEQTHSSGHTLGFWAASLLNVLDPRYKLLLVRAGPASRMVDELRTRMIDPASCLIVDPADASLERLFSAADVILLPATGLVSPAAVAMAMASGRPIVASATPQLCELLEDRHTALLVREPSPRLLAQRILDLAADPHESQRLPDRARAEIYELLTQAKMIELYRQLYTTVGSRHSAYSPSLAKPSEA
jgi:glycosyltransferase involved in cell wall biosynthesis